MGWDSNLTLCDIRKGRDGINHNLFSEMFWCDRGWFNGKNPNVSNAAMQSCLHKVFGSREGLVDVKIPTQIWSSIVFYSHMSPTCVTYHIYTSPFPNIISDIVILIMITIDYNYCIACWTTVSNSFSMMTDDLHHWHCFEIEILLIDKLCTIQHVCLALPRYQGR